MRVGSQQVPVPSSGIAHFSAVAPRISVQLIGAADIAHIDPPMQKRWGARSYTVDTTKLDEVTIALK